MAAMPDSVDVVAEVLAAIADRDLARLRATLHPEFRHQLVYPVAGMLSAQNRVQFLAMMTSVATLFDHYAMTIHAIHGMRDPELAVAELSVEQRFTANRQPYDNRHCLFFRVCHGLVIELREYADTARLNALIRGTEDATWEMAIN